MEATLTSDGGDAGEVRFVAIDGLDGDVAACALFAIIARSTADARR